MSKKILQRSTVPWISLLLLAVVLLGVSSVQAQGGLTVEIIAGYNLVVDSNATATSTYAPEVATVIGRFCNTTGSTLQNVYGYIGNYVDGTTNDQPGLYPVLDSATLGGTHPLYNTGNYAFQHVGGSTGLTDARRYIGTLAAGECAVQYWHFRYPHCRNEGGVWRDPPCVVPTWGTSVKPDDDLSLSFDVWVKADGATPASASRTMTMRNEISAMANKIEPNPDGQWFNTEGNTVLPGDVITSNGILYELGLINQGFDNDGDYLPDYNAWLQPIGDAGYDPSCFRLIRTSGTLTATRGGGYPDLVISFDDRDDPPSDPPEYGGPLYFTNLPDNNTGVRGKVFYTFLALDGPCSTDLTPYQEVASGRDNEKFNADYGTGIPPVGSTEPTVTIDKTGETTIAEGGTIHYSIPFQNTSTTSRFGLTLAIGGVNMPLVVSDTVPTGLWYVAGSAVVNTFGYTPSDPAYTVRFSRDRGATWTADPGTVQSTAASPVWIQWWLGDPLPTSPTGSATARYNAEVRSGHVTNYGPVIENCADASLGGGTPFAEACAVTLVNGTGTIGDLVWKDDDADGIKDAGETGIDGVHLYLYWDRTGDGVLGDDDVLVKEMDSSGTGDPNYDFTQLPAADYLVVVDGNDAQVPTGYALTTQSMFAVSLAVGQDYNDADFGFGPVLVLDKFLSSADPAYEGENVTFTIRLRNTRPGDGTAAGYCVYTVRPSIVHVDGTFSPPGGGTVGKQWVDTARILGAPDNQYAHTEMTDANEALGLSGFNTAPYAGNITKVETLIQFREGQDFDTNSELYVRVWDDSLGGSIRQDTYDWTYFSGPAGTTYTIRQDVTAARTTWTWANFAANATEMQLEANKGSGPDGGETEVDAVAYLVTTDDTSCGDENYVIATLPLTDTYDADLLQFVSADPAASTSGTSGSSPNTAGTLTWANLGPLYGGGTRDVTVVFRALDPGGDSTTTINYAEVKNAAFASGRPVNDVADNDDVIIIATGSIAGTVWAEGSGGTTGWVGTTGYEGLGTTDVGIPGATATLYACVDTATGEPISGPTNNKTCAQQTNGAWQSIATTTTDEDGYYEFTGLHLAYYYVQITLPGWTGAVAQTAEAVQAAAGRTCTAGTCNNIWEPSGTAPTWGSSNLRSGDTTVFNPIGTLSGGSLGTPNEDITNVNFGYQTIPARIYGWVYEDTDGNGFQGDDDRDNGNEGESDWNGVTVYLCNQADLTCAAPVATTTTLADGSFGFTGYTGSFYVKVVQPGNTTQTDDPDNVGTCPSCDNQTAGFTIQAGQTMGPYVFGYQPAGTYSIGDTLYVDWNGDGRQGDGSEANGNEGEEGIAGVTVYLYEDEDGDGSIDPGVDALIATDVTDGNGIYGFASQPNGSYLVVVDTADPQYPATHTQTQDPDDDTGTCADTSCNNLGAVTVNDADDYTLDFGFQPVGYGSIGDLVWHDDDGDGVHDPDEAGIDAVAVHLYQDQDGDGVIDPEDALVDTDITADGGIYGFDGLPAGDYIVQIDPFSFLSGNALEDLTMSTTDDPPYDVAQVSYMVDLAAGEEFLDADFGFTSSAIGDLVWMDNNGNGEVDGGEAGIPGVAMELWLTDNSGNRLGGSPYATTSTGSDGRYYFTGLPAGEYVVVLASSNFGEDAVLDPAVFTQTYDPDAADVPCGGECDGEGQVWDPDEALYGLPLGQTDYSLDFGFQPSGIIGDRIWLDSDGDGVQDSGELGIPNVRVQLNDGVCTLDDDCLETWTDPAGIYSFGDLDAGTYTVVVDASTLPAGVAQTGDPDQPNTTCSACDHQGSTALPEGGSVLTLDFGYDYSGSTTIAGTIFWDSLRDGDIYGDPADVPLAGITVYLWQGSTPLGTTVTNASGDYLFTGLPAAGNYIVSINPNAPSLQTLDMTYNVDENGGVCSTCANYITVSTLTGNAVDQDLGFYGELPTAVILASFLAFGQPGHILLTWETVSEVNLSGFNLYRSDAADGARVQLNGQLIASSQPGSPAGSAYQFIDSTAVPGITYYYWLELVDAAGEHLIFGPSSAAGWAAPEALYRTFLPQINK